MWPCASLMSRRNAVAWSREPCLSSQFTWLIMLSRRSPNARTNTSAWTASRSRGRSAQDVADRTAELGYPISRTQIANYESGRKKNLDIAELLILAAALDVPPLVLLYPDLPAGKVEIIPNEPGNSFDAYLWATGIAPPFLNPGTPSKGSQLITAVRRRHELMAELARILVEKSKARDDTSRESLESQQAEVSGEIGRLNALIGEVGGVLNDG
jgi:transcriptional regulator with XRE-family HTH domain